MIFVDRSKVTEPDILSNQTRRGHLETQEAIRHYSVLNLTTAFNFKVYRHAEVKKALIDLFKGKCAYCESTFLHVYSGDVEHFRPKGEIEEVAEPKKPGYYWLASNWDNLLLSCRNCNQKLSHLMFGQAGRVTMGKMNQFPLSDLDKYVRKHDNPTGIESEEKFRLLLNPCIDNPEKHLEYGDEGVIKAKKNEDGLLCEKGLKSIDVFVLQRVHLVQSREKTLIDIEAQIQRVKEAVENYNFHIADLNDSKKFYFEKILKRELDRLYKFLKPEEPYLGMARQVIGKFLDLNFGIKLKN
ncbi:hypothetical protein [Flavobacterium limi]|uniref:TIGR02646 family protein n=1 Tax=Flavobacterium limi TaxID=2045105 RepID=A0ABQ1UZJ3_9FLAO|nr:hypothetical protein [Flavobacterium limi]GGF30280.1 hypothetical protein GCM10011518_44410 [Flavobacterium limi]